MQVFKCDEIMLARAFGSLWGCFYFLRYQCRIFSSLYWFIEEIRFSSRDREVFVLMVEIECWGCLVSVDSRSTPPRRSQGFP